MSTAVNTVWQRTAPCPRWLGCQKPGPVTLRRGNTKYLTETTHAYDSAPLFDDFGTREPTELFTEPLRTHLRALDPERTLFDDRTTGDAFQGRGPA